MSLPRVVAVPLPTYTSRVLEWGDPQAPLVLALHGFPDTAWTWRYLGPYLAERGYRVAAPFLRGYGPSSVPSDDTYTVGSLMADAVAVHGALGGDDRSMLVGHDWGAIATSGLGAHPDSPFRRIVTMAVPPLPSMTPSREWLGQWVGAAVRQPRNSWYIAFNQVPGLAERHFERLVTKLWHDWSPGYDATEDLDFLLSSVPDRAHAQAVLSYYRAFLRPGRGARAYAEWHRTFADAPSVPTLFLQGDQDGCLDRRFFTGASLALTGGSRATLVPGVGHFLQVERPEVVNALVAEFLDEA
ncbi:MAG: alpha/beta fold hydrolase [Nocardioides sp.]|uniref:alpha/beta fold hydrolase n=1 Tax=Nocardioides sp. TaxID=35761 RepID=UPI00238B82E2|nr:alpha/beta fold hydrolase [Nocardioides sp.]MDE0775582.1 alpha/beta fold hydrolase [Nocardioides sp.]